MTVVTVPFGGLFIPFPGSLRLSMLPAAFAVSAKAIVRCLRKVKRPFTFVWLPFKFCKDAKAIFCTYQTFSIILWRRRLPVGANSPFFRHTSVTSVGESIEGV